MHQFRANANTWAKTPFPYEDENEPRSKEQRQENQRKLKQNIDTAIQDPHNRSEITEDGAIQRWYFRTRNGPIVYEKLLGISIDDHKPFTKTKFLADFEKLCASWYDKTPSPCVEALQLELAKRYLAMRGGYRDNKDKHKEPKKHIQASYDTLWAMPGGESDWSRVKDEHVALLRDEDPESQPLRKILREVLEKWSHWKQYAVDYLYNNKRNSFTSTHEGYYREPPADAKYILVDRNGKLVIFLDPNGVEGAYGPDAKRKMEEDTDNYFAIKKPAATEGNQRWRGEEEHFRLNPHLTPADCGTDYYGGWHASGHPKDPMHATPDYLNLQPDEKEVLLEYMKGTNGLMTRLVDHWFGVFEPELLQEYRDVYKAVPESARLPPNCAEEEESFTLRAFLRNRQTYEHVDGQDWKGGLVGLLQIGTFSGGALLFNELRLKLSGYRSGAVVLFRGNLLKHFVQPCKLTPPFHGTRSRHRCHRVKTKVYDFFWRDANVETLTGQGIRTAFDFTTKDTVRRLPRQDSHTKDKNEPTATASTAVTAAPAHSRQPDDPDTLVGASHATSLGKRKRPHIEEADDMSYLPRARPTVATRSSSNEDPASSLEPTTARALGPGVQEDSNGDSTFGEFPPTFIPRKTITWEWIAINNRAA